MTAALPIARARAEPGWRLHLAALGAIAAAILLVFRADAAGMAAIWWTSETFNHCFLILPLIAWLVWQRLPGLARIRPAAWAPGLLGVAAGAGAWLLGEAGSMAVLRHAGVVLMLQGAVVACLGKAASRALFFPIVYAVFLVPAGEEIVPLLQTVTARMSMVLLGIAGVPAHIEGIFISTPAGYFKVAEACSGLQFLVAMLAYGALVANVCFRSWRRRAAFMAAAIFIPILANGVRAAGTIWIAERSGIEFAAGFDHIVYGWIFFAVVIALLMAAGWPFFDRRPGDPWFDPAALQPGPPPAAADRGLAAIAVAAIALAALPPLWSVAIASAGSVKPPASLELPQVQGWQAVAAGRGRSWAPNFAGADIVRTGRYRDAAGREVDLAIAVFARQSEGRELIGFGQGAAGPGSGWSWTADGEAPPNGRAELISSHGTIREVVSFYRVGNIVTGSAAKAKLETVRVRLLGGPQRAVAILVSAEAIAKGGNPRPSIDAFVAALGPVDRLADEAAGLPHTR
jgi:exosortase A